MTARQRECITKILQEMIHEAERGVVNGVWRSVCAFFEMSTYVAALIFHKPE
jgi:hypothetical protein